MRTFSTSIGWQLLGNMWDNFFVVTQYDACVLAAADSYFFEWKKVMSLLEAVTRSLISKIFTPWYLIVSLILANFTISSIFNGPVFSKKG